MINFPDSVLEVDKPERATDSGTKEYSVDCKYCMRGGGAGGDEREGGRTSYDWATYRP